jgi:hypothetical protein
MKNMIVLFILFFSVLSYSAEKKETSAIIQTDQIDQVEKFSEIEILQTKDLDSTVLVLKSLVALDNTDKSRTTAQMLTTSYKKNKNIYQSAFKKLSKSEKIIIKDIFKMLTELGSGGGNG